MRSNDSFAACASGSSQTRSWRIFRGLWSSALALLIAAPLVAQQQKFDPNLTLAPTRDSKIVKRWSIAGEPRGVALGADGTIYVGLAQAQAVVAIDPKSGTVRNTLVLDSAEIAATKELVTLRTNRDASRLYIANGSDESATILDLPSMKIVREITIEGESIRDALPDPKGRYLYLLGRRVHVYDANGERELRTLDFDNPMAIATTSDGASVALIGTEDFGNAKATSVVVYETSGFAEVAREPLQTDRLIEAALFAANDRALIAAGREWLYEKPINTHAAKAMKSEANGRQRMTIDFGDLVNSDRICLPEGSGAQIAVAGANDALLFAERRCQSSGTFAGSSRRITPISLYGVNAYALAYDRAANTLIATDKAGFVTIYKVPRAAVVR